MRRAVQEAACVPPVTASVGVAATWPKPEEPAEELVMRLVGQADVPLYEVKASGRNGVRVRAA
jgi:PleD family two-component response regulator